MSDDMADKANFDEAYNHPTSVKYYHQILIGLELWEREETLGKYMERGLNDKLRQWAKDLGHPLLVLDFLSSYGNTLLAITNSFHKKDFDAMWASEETCHTLSKPRQFPCHTWATDISQAALDYGQKAGIFDEGQVLDMNHLSAEEERLVADKCRSANVLHANSLCYLEDGVFEKIMGWFAEGSGPGLLVMGLVNPYDGVDRMRAWKQLALSRLQFHDSIPCKNRKLQPAERAKFGPLYGIHSTAYYENWLLFRKGTTQ